MSLRLDWCSHEAARYACEHWYSRSEMPVGKLVKIGVWEDGQFVGVLIFGCGTGGVAKIGERLGAGPKLLAATLALMGLETLVLQATIQVVYPV